MPAAPTGLLGHIAVHNKLITPQQLQEAMTEQMMHEQEPKLGEILVAKGWISEAQLQKLLDAQRRYLDKQAEQRQEHRASKRQMRQPSDTGAGKAEVEEILKRAVAAHAGDIQIHSGAPLHIRVHGQLVAAGKSNVDGDRARRILMSILDDDLRTELKEKGEVDFAYALEGVGRFRANIFQQQRGLNGVFRHIAPTPPSLEDLGLPSELARLTHHHQGLVLVTGPAGSGKSSTLAALANIINNERRDHILTVEDPVEFVHQSRGCIVSQRQVKRHTESFSAALKGALREDPDIIIIGEIRDLETVSLALTAAETGHLVLGTMTTTSAIRTIDRVIGMFPPERQGQVRAMASESLRAVITQKLVRRTDGTGRVPALELLIFNRAVSNMIRDEKTFQLSSVLQTGSAQGMMMMDVSLAGLVRDGTISKEEALRAADDGEKLAKMLGGAA